MIIYYIIFLILLFLAFLEQLKKIKPITKTKIIKFASFSFVILSTVYAGYFGDYNSYKLHFDTRPLSFGFTFNGAFEPFYELLCVITRLFTNEYWTFRLVLAILVMWLWYKIYTRKDNIIIENYAILIILARWCTEAASIFIVRSTIATAICIYSLKYVEIKDFKRFIICTIIAICFHIMSFFWLIVYIAYWKWKVHTLLIIYTMIIPPLIVFKDTFFSSILNISDFFPKRFADRLEGYITYGLSSSEKYSTILLLRGLVNVIFLTIIFFYLYKRFKKHNVMEAFYHVFNGYFKIYIIGAIIYSITLPISGALARAASPFITLGFFMLPCIFMLPEFNYLKSKHNHYNRICAFFLLSLYFLNRLLSFIYSTQVNFVTIFSR